MVGRTLSEELTPVGLYHHPSFGGGEGEVESHIAMMGWERAMQSLANTFELLPFRYLPPFELNLGVGMLFHIKTFLVDPVGIDDARIRVNAGIVTTTAGVVYDFTFAASSENGHKDMVLALGGYKGGDAHGVDAASVPFCHPLNLILVSGCFST